MRIPLHLLLCPALALASCGGDDEAEVLATEIGDGDHTPASVTFTVIATVEEGLNQPRDLEFNPLRPNELWVSLPVVIGTLSHAAPAPRRPP